MDVNCLIIFNVSIELTKDFLNIRRAELYVIHQFSMKHMRQLGWNTN